MCNGAVLDTRLEGFVAADGRHRLDEEKGGNASQGAEEDECNRRTVGCRSVTAQ
jgi:hypothetical protein